MRTRTQERIETLARERDVASGEGGAPIDLALVEEGIEIGKQEMAAMIATYPTPGKGAAAAALGAEALAKAAPTPAPVDHDVKQSRNIADAQSKAQVVPAVGNGNGYLNEVSSLNVPHEPAEDRRD
jgi:hypothetical protein